MRAMSRACLSIFALSAGFLGLSAGSLQQVSSKSAGASEVQRGKYLVEEARTQMRPTFWKKGSAQTEKSSGHQCTSTTCPTQTRRQSSPTCGPFRQVTTDALSSTRWPTTWTSVRTRLSTETDKRQRDRGIASRDSKCQTCCKGVDMTNEQVQVLAAVRAAAFAAEATGLTNKEICDAAVEGLYSEAKGGRSPMNYNPVAECLEDPKK